MSRARAALLALATAQVAYGRCAPHRPVGATRALVAGMLVVSALDAHAARGRRGVAAVGAAGAVGFAAEVVGVRTGRPFGRYEYSGKLGPRVGGVPVLAAAAWGAMARPAWVVAGRLSRRWRVPVAAGALTAWDVFLDPRMARDGYWAWPGGGRYEGIPASNFAGWLATGTGVFALWALIDPGDDGSPEALALYVWTWIGETVANLVFWRRPATALAGSLAMGAFAVPALAR